MSKRAEINQFCTILPFSPRFTHPKQDFNTFSSKSSFLVTFCRFSAVQVTLLVIYDGFKWALCVKKG